jgi:hypothetical protein
VAYELALLTILLWVTGLFWPLMRFEYQFWFSRSWSGSPSSSTAMTMPTTMTLSQLPVLLFTSSLQQQVMGTSFVVVVAMLLVLPVVLIILAAAAWLHATRSRHWRNVLYVLHPCHDGLPLVVTLLSLIPGQGHSESPRYKLLACFWNCWL